MSQKLAGKVAVVTGGNSGIGLATAKLFAASGARVFITGRRQSELDAAVKQCGANVTAVQGDVSKLADLDRLYVTVKQQAGRNSSVYSATKAAVRSFARGWTADLKRRKIRVNVISPGPIATPMGASIPDEMAQAIAREVPMGRFGAADEIARPALFLASDDSSYITGIELFVDGGIGQV